MKAQSEKVYSFLTTQTGFTTALGTKLYPLVANEGTPFPFSTYRIITTEGETKDADKAIVTLSIFYSPDQYTECITTCDTVEELIKNRFNWVSSDVDFIQEDQSFVASINFEIT